MFPKQSRCSLLSALVVAQLLLIQQICANRTEPKQFSIDVFEVKVGHVFVISGTTGYSDVKLEFVGATEDDVIFSISVNRQKPEISLNNGKDKKSYVIPGDSQMWEKYSTGGCCDGTEFRISIQVELGNKFAVAFNNQHVALFEYPVEISAIRKVVALKKHSVASFKQLDHRAIYPLAIPAVHRSDQMNNRQNIVFSNDIPQRFTAGDRITITAVASGNSTGTFIVTFTDDSHSQIHDIRDHSFAIDLQNKSVIGWSENENHERVRITSKAVSFNPIEPFVIDIDLQPKVLNYILNGTVVMKYEETAKIPYENLAGFKVQVTDGFPKFTVSVTSVQYTRVQK